MVTREQYELILRLDALPQELREKFYEALRIAEEVARRNIVPVSPPKPELLS